MPYHKEEAMKDGHRFTPTGQAGFTLLELLMVVIIIAILAAIALPQYLRVAERSRAAEALQTLGPIRGSEQRFRAQNGVYTVNLAAIDIDVPGFNAVPASPNWTFTVAGTGLTDNIVATRVAGGATIQQSLDNGVTCSSDAQYGLPTPANC